MNLIITCEHAGHEVPEEFLHLFERHQEVLHSHRGWDPGALTIARYLAEKLNAPHYYQPVTRLLIEMNRSLDSHQLFSEFTITLSAQQRLQIIRDYYDRYRNPVTTKILSSPKPVIHLSIHSFTPIWNDNVRPTDIGLLFDPNRRHELNFCTALQQYLNQSGTFRVDFNEPYRGTDDGFTTYLRTQFSGDDYLGIEIEVNQKYAHQSEAIASALAPAILAAAKSLR